MGSLVDSLRQNPPVNHRAVVWGVDPDLRTLGWARLQVAYTIPSTAAVGLEQLDFGIWAAGSKQMSDIDQANAMIASLASPDAPWQAYPSPQGGQWVVAEAQRVYPNPNDDRPKVIAKANDLLRLAQISGAFQGTLHTPVDRTRSYLPHVWKGQAKKETMAAHAITRLHQQTCTVMLWERGLAKHIPAMDMLQLAKSFGDALDAVCMAIFGADEISSGRWAA